MRIAVLVLMAFALFSGELYAGKSACRKKFESNLLAIKRKACGQLSRACWKQVKKGRSNGSAILQACSDKEVDVAKSIEKIEGRNVSICNAPCPELNRKGVCLYGLSKASYYRRLRLNPGCI